MSALIDWLNQKNNSNWFLYIKRLSANDTGLTKSNQSGIYIPEEVVNTCLPSINHKLSKNPDCEIEAKISSHELPEKVVRGVYYNSRHFGKSRNEYRITQWKKGISYTPLQDHDCTGALSLFAFDISNIDKNSSFIDVWVCKGIDEEDIIESMIGEVLPGSWVGDRCDILLNGFSQGLRNKEKEIKFPENWLYTFPTGSEIIEHLTKNFPLNYESPDKLLIKRRELEYKLFRLVEEKHILTVINNGFNSVDEFMSLANSVSNRRKSRSGKSLELHLELIFKQFNLNKFSTQCITEGRKKPDFLFPSCSDYHNINFPREKLRMLAVKTTCKDRWRQVLNEANDIKEIHLFTLQEGVSINQFQEMKDENVKLVVPSPLHKKYPESIRGELTTLEHFINETKSMYGNI
ncbi:type II restriction endonuclease [Oceanimonas smirnovii]|uniref:type II restriction endonuclease n=1 Tax=Oceanimonas smirnovii TaxID=264574 RepID=UPI003AAA78B1